MRFLIIVKATPQSEAGAKPDDALRRAMAAYRDDLAGAGVLLDGGALLPSAAGWRIRHDGGARTVVNGPFAETRELVSGYVLIQVRSREEALEWTKRMPNPAIDGARGEIEVRQLST